MNWHMNGTGTVSVRIGEQQIDFDEKIELANGRICHDKKRWRFVGERVFFDRFRNDDYEQIFEFVYENGVFLPQEHYWCEPDAYSAELSIQGQNIVFTMFIHSSRKNERLRYEYFRTKS